MIQCNRNQWWRTQWLSIGVWVGLMLFSLLDPLVAQGASEPLAELPEPLAGLRIANALDHGEGVLQVELAGEPWASEGLMAGEVTALRRMHPGGYRVRFLKHGMETEEIGLILRAGATTTLVPHAVWNEVEAKWELRALQLHDQKEQRVERIGQSENPERWASVHHVGSQAQLIMEFKPVGCGWKPLQLSRLNAEQFPIRQHRGYLPLRVGRQRLRSMPVFAEGHHVLILYRQKDGQLASLSYRDRSWPSGAE